MKILVIGGTKFVGKHLVIAAQNSGHEVTLFNRGQTNPGLFDNVEQITGDRDGNLNALKNRKWDVAIDTCGYVPRIVKQSVDVLTDAVNSYLFISTISVYGDLSEPGISENSDLATMENGTTEEITGETYGPLKVLCEKTVLDSFGDRSLIIRPGLIVGPDDPTDRFSYWVKRISEGGKVACPMPKDYAVQFIDVRDLGEWSIRMLENNRTGIYNATGPEKIITMEEYLKSCQMTLNKTADLIWLEQQFLLDNDIKPWTELPLWLTGDEQKGFGRVDISKAIKAGLGFRDLEVTLKDTLEWLDKRPSDYEWKAGMTPEKEALLLKRLS